MSAVRAARRARPIVLAAVALLLCSPDPAASYAQEPAEPGPSAHSAAARPAAAAASPAGLVPDLTALVDTAGSGLAAVVDRYAEDRAALLRRYDARRSPTRLQRVREFGRAWLTALDTVDFRALELQGRVDLVLLENELEHELAEADRREDLMEMTAPLLPFAETITGLHEARRRLEPVDPRSAAETLAALAERVAEAERAVEAGLEDAADRTDDADRNGASENVSGSGSGARSRAGAPGGGIDRRGAGGAGRRANAGVIRTTELAAYRAAEMLDDLRGTLEDWYEYHHGYDPLFTWWVEAPYERADSALEGYRRLLRGEVVGIEPGGEEPIVGTPIGREALLEDLEHEMIAYSPEELIEIARRELAWGEEQMVRAARELGHGDDWRAALEAVKRAHVEPGGQPELIRGLAREAEAYVEEHDLVTVPPLAREVWRMEMMSPERQRVAPFFLGGERILVSYPTSTMEHEYKLMSMRGNNRHFARATVFHELIPGHHLQRFMNERYRPYRRRVFGTPFWHEGNAFYWETLLWDRGFTSSPEDRIGALFWRNHRAARIIFSLSFHLGEMTPQECIDFLVERVGHERANAEAEVRRSFNGSYSPLYQVAYMMGGLQFRALHRELVGAGRMTDREFHDAILRNGSMPVEMVRAVLTGRAPDRDFEAAWRFAEQPAQSEE